MIVTRKRRALISIRIRLGRWRYRPWDLSERKHFSWPTRGMVMVT